MSSLTKTTSNSGEMTSAEAMFSFLAMKAEGDAKISTETVQASNALVQEQRSFRTEMMDLFKKQAETIAAQQKQIADLQAERLKMNAASLNYERETNALVRALQTEIQTLRKESATKQDLTKLRNGVQEFERDFEHYVKNVEVQQIPYSVHYRLRYRGPFHKRQFPDDIKPVQKQETKKS